MPKGPTFKQAGDYLTRHIEGARPVEQRQAESYGYRGRMGRSSITIICPWCGSHVEAFTWSLSGGGKRCECGAIFGSSGSAWHWASREPSNLRTPDA